MDPSIKCSRRLKAITSRVSNDLAKDTTQIPIRLLKDRYERAVDEQRKLGELVDDLVEIDDDALFNEASALFDQLNEWISNVARQLESASESIVSVLSSRTESVFSVSPPSLVEPVDIKMDSPKPIKTEEEQPQVKVTGMPTLLQQANMVQRPQPSLLDFNQYSTNDMYSPETFCHSPMSMGSSAPMATSFPMPSPPKQLSAPVFNIPDLLTPKTGEEDDYQSTTTTITPIVEQDTLDFIVEDFLREKLENMDLKQRRQMMVRNISIDTTADQLLTHLKQYARIERISRITEEIVPVKGSCLIATVLMPDTREAYKLYKSAHMSTLHECAIRIDWYTEPKRKRGPPPVTCPVCPETANRHAFEDCPLNVDNLIDQLNSKKLCWNCAQPLAVGGAFHRCPPGIFCTICDEPHHTTLHKAEVFKNVKQEIAEGINGKAHSMRKAPQQRSRGYFTVSSLNDVEGAPRRPAMAPNGGHRPASANSNGYRPKSFSRSTTRSNSNESLERSESPLPRSAVGPPLPRDHHAFNSRAVDDAAERPLQKMPNKVQASKIYYHNPIGGEDLSSDEDDDDLEDYHIYV